MNIYSEEFPEDRIHDPKRQAELTVFRELQASETPGVALFEARAGIDGREVDYAIWLEDIARTGLQVKGDATAWTVASGISLPREVRGASPARPSRAGGRPYSSTTDLQERRPAGIPSSSPCWSSRTYCPTPTSRPGSTQAGVSVLFGTENLVERLIEAVATCRVNYPPSGDETAEEVELLVPGTMRVALGIPEALDLHADNAVFQNVQTVII